MAAVVIHCKCKPYVVLGVWYGFEGVIMMHHFNSGFLLFLKVTVTDPMQTEEEERKKGKSDEAVERLMNRGECGCARCNKT